MSRRQLSAAGKIRNTITVEHGKKPWYRSAHVCLKPTGVVIEVVVRNRSDADTARAILPTLWVLDMEDGYSATVPINVEVE